jgi:hypothetical protein
LGLSARIFSTVLLSHTAYLRSSLLLSLKLSFFGFVLQLLSALIRLSVTTLLCLSTTGTSEGQT